VRYFTALSPQKYIQAMETDESAFEYPRTPATEQVVVVDRLTEITDTLLMGLRLTKEGIQRGAFQKRFGADLLDLYGAMTEKYAAYGLLYIDDEVVRLTRQGRLLSNTIFRELV
jgi:oxygen-independent coproporphyrinogen-3 oxidase